MAEMPHVERRGDSLVVRFPAADFFECTEAGCRATFKANNWTATRRSLERHLKRDHDIRIRSVANICGKCNSALGLRPTVHACSVRTPEGLRPAAPNVFAFRCDVCDQTFPTKRGLYNHAQWHKDQERGPGCRGAAAPPDREEHETTRLRRGGDYGRIHSATGRGPGDDGSAVSRLCLSGFPGTSPSCQRRFRFSVTHSISGGTRVSCWCHRR
jgi:hypothetical protein